MCKQISWNCLQHSSEYPALTSALNLLDEVFDLQSRSQWLRRGLINRLLGQQTELNSIGSEFEKLLLIDFIQIDEYLSFGS